jgi:UDP-N-acetylglucosamine acyltransferase
LIHPTAIIESDVHIGQGVTIGPYSVIRNNVIIGDNSYISPHVVIGEEAEHSTNKYEINQRDYNGQIVIGKKVTIREFTQVCRPLKSITLIDDDAYIMGHCYIAHDCQIGKHVVISNNATLGGWTRVMFGANLGLGAVVHQYTTIGQYAMIAANASVVKDVPPLSKYIPYKELGVNSYAIKKWNLPLDSKSISDMIKSQYYEDLLKDFSSQRNSDRSVYS